MRKRRLIGGALLVLGLLAGLPAAAEASHFRFGLITWVPRPDLGPRTVEFTVKQSWRRSACGAPVVGNTACNFSALNFGDATSASIVGTVVAIDAAEDWYLATATIIHTYPAVNNGGVPWVARFDTCCRIYGLVNASGGSLSVQSTVDLSLSNASPVSSVFPIVQMAVNAVNNVTLPVADADGDTLSCRMATPGESAIGSQPAATFPLSVSTGCVLTWNTAGTSVGQLWAAQVVIEESRGGNPPHGRVALDFIIKIVNSIGTAPVCDVPPTPTGTVVLPVNTAYTATIQGSDADAGNTLTINSTGLPTGATLTPPAGSSSGSPFASTFSWTPGPADIGLHPIQFSFTDNTGQAAFCSFTISVPANTPPVAKCADVTVSTAPNVCSATGSINNGSYDPDGDPITVEQSPSTPVGPGVTTATLTVTDSHGASSSCTATITVVDNQQPAITCSAPQVLECTSPSGAAASVSATSSDNCAVTSASCSPGSGTFAIGFTPVTCSADDAAGNSSSCSTSVKVVDTVAPQVSCVPSYNPSGKNVPKALNEDGFYLITTSDLCTAAPTVSLGSYVIANGETIKITQAPGQSGVVLVNTMGPAAIRHFRVGPGDATLIATDGSGNTTTVSCLVPPPPK